MKQGEVYLCAPSPITGERELRVIVSSDAYNTRPGCVSVLVAEIETGTRLRPTQHGILTDYGVVLADRIVWFPVEMVGERFGAMESLGRNRALIDGNERLAWNTTWFFLGLNGHPLGAPLDEDAAEFFVVDVVTGKLELQQIASGLVRFAA